MPARPEFTRLKRQGPAPIVISLFYESSFVFAAMANCMTICAKENAFF